MSFFCPFLCLSLSFEMVVIVLVIALSFFGGVSGTKENVVISL